MAKITIIHTHEDGTLLTGSKKGDGVYEIVTKHGFTWRRRRGICINPSRDHDAKTWIINPTAAALREAGHEVTVDIDNTPRPTAVVEAERADRAADRADRLAQRAEKADAAGDARLAAARRITDGIPFGQPIQPPGHHSRNAHINALNRADNHRGKATEQWRKAEHLGQRASGSVAHQKQRVNPRVTMRRIETLEADKRRLQRDIDGYERTFRNGRGEIVIAEKHEPSTGQLREDLQRRIAHLDEQITYWRGQLDEQAESGAFVPWGKEHFVKGDRVRHHGFPDWYEVTRVNTKSVSVASSGWPRTITWDDVAGRRRDGMQWDTVNGDPWPVELADKVARWPALQWVLNRKDYGDDAMRKRINIEHAQRIVLGLALDASPAEVKTFLEGLDDVDTARTVKAAFVDVYDRLAGGEKTPDVKASYTPIVLEAAWRMPDREPERRIAARSAFARHDIPAVRAGDLIVGWYERGSKEHLYRSFCGPVVTVSEVNDRREAGEWVTITLVDGQEMTTQTHQLFAVHPAGTWEQEADAEAKTDEVTAADPGQPDTPAAPKECGAGRRRAIPFACRLGAGHKGDCSPYTLPPTVRYEDQTVVSTKQDGPLDDGAPVRSGAPKPTERGVPDAALSDIVRPVCPECEGDGAGEGYGPAGAGGVCTECGGTGEVTREKMQRLLGKYAAGRTPFAARRRGPLAESAPNPPVRISGPKPPESGVPAADEADIVEPEDGQFFRVVAFGTCRRCGTSQAGPGGLKALTCDECGGQVPLHDEERLPVPYPFPPITVVAAPGASVDDEPDPWGPVLDEIESGTSV